MKWFADKLLLIAVSAVMLVIGWAVARFTGQWFWLLLNVIAFGSMFVDNTRLRKLLQKHGIDPREGIRKR